jgi:hypothetical protein
VLYCTLKSLSRATPASCCALNACVFRRAAVVWCIVNTPCHLALAMRPARRNCSDVNAALRRCTFCPVCVAAPRSPHRGCATAQRYLTLVRFDRACLCVPLHARTYCHRFVVGERCCALTLGGGGSRAVHVAHKCDTGPLIVRAAVAVFHCCSVIATATQCCKCRVCGVAALDVQIAVACGCAMPPAVV